MDNKIDIKDIAEFDKAGAGGASSAGALAHVTKEQQLKAEAGGVKGIYPTGALAMHNGGITSENKVNGNFRVEGDGGDVFFEVNLTKTVQSVIPNATGVLVLIKLKSPNDE